METKKLSKSEKIKKNITEIAKETKRELNKEFKECKFSVTTEKYRGGQSLDVVLLEAPFTAIKKWEDLSDKVKKDLEVRNLKEDRKRDLKRDHLQVNSSHLENEKRERITEEAFKIFKKARELLEQYNYDNSRPQEDYFDVNFYYNFKIGRYDQPFKRKE